MSKWGLVRVSEDFRVIALGLPVPRYQGVTLDPPLRSRFQCRDVIAQTHRVRKYKFHLSWNRIPKPPIGH